MGFNMEKKFHYPLADSHIVYLSDRHLIIQNLKDQSQKVLESIS